MAKHARRAPVPKKLLIGSAISAGAVLIIVLAVLLLHNGLLETLAGVFGPPPRRMFPRRRTPLRR